MNKSDYMAFETALVKHLTNISGEDYDAVYYYIGEYDFDPSDPQMVRYVAKMIAIYASIRRPDSYTSVHGMNNPDDLKRLAAMFLVGVGERADLADLTCGEIRSQKDYLYKVAPSDKRDASITKYSVKGGAPSNVTDLAKAREYREKKSMENNGITYIPNADKLLEIIKECLVDKPIDNIHTAKYTPKQKANWSVDWNSPGTWIILIIAIYSILSSFAEIIH